jgi:hypothetical protein
MQRKDFVIESPFGDGLFERREFCSQSDRFGVSLRAEEIAVFGGFRTNVEFALVDLMV